MPTDQRPMHFRTSFDQTADDYDAIRPGYPRDLITDIVMLAVLPTPAGCVAKILSDASSSVVEPILQHYM